MMKLKPNLTAFQTFIMMIPGLLHAQDLKNGAYQIAVQPDSRVSISTARVSGATLFSPEFTILSRDATSKFELKKETTTAYTIPTWKSVRDGKETHNLFDAGEIASVKALRSEVKDGRIHWIFPEQNDFTLESELALPDDAEPQVTVRFTPKKKASYSVGYTGAPVIPRDKLESLWQPLVWQERRFPDGCYLSLESMCSIPAVLAEKESVSIGIAADPDVNPYRMPVQRNSRFGVALRNRDGLAQPMLFAPVLCGADSAMEPGKTYTFRFRLVVRAGDCTQTYRYLARAMFGFADYRENQSCSLNQTLENIIDYAMNDTFSGWVPEQKGSDYSTDVPGSIKNVSALHPLSIALITDNADIYRRRALPMTEYLLSRQKYLFAPRENITHQGASYLMNGPAAEVSELGALFHMFGGKSEVFRHYALELFDKPRALNLFMVSEGGSWQNCLAVYRLTGDRKFLERAVAGADAYIAKRVEKLQEDFSDVHVDTGGQFWTDYAPKWVDLLELHEETKDPRHLQAAVSGANTYSEYIWMHPRIPEGDVSVNPDGKVGIYYKTRNPDAKPMRAPEQQVPAWTVSPIGLTPEASRTHAGNPAIFLAHYAAYMLRLGHLNGDSYFHDIGRSAVVGRYSNFPGYDLCGEFTNVYSRPDYPMRPWKELTYNNIYYNHIWPQIALLMDYLVSDAFVKSDGKISFPSRYAQGYAFLFSKVYGDRSGTFYGDRDVRLWMPRQLLECDNIQLNYVAGYGNGNFYLGLMNQSARQQEAVVKLNPNVVPVQRGRTYPVRTWVDHQLVSGQSLELGSLKVTVPAHGIVGLAVDGLKVSTQFQEQVFTTATASSSESYVIRETEIGKVTSMLLSMSPAVTNAFVWLGSTPKQVSSAMLELKRGDKVTTSVDAIYPFEFSIPLSESDGEVEVRLKATAADGKVVSVDGGKLKR